MDRFLDLVTESNFTFGRNGVSVAAVLVISLWVLLPRGIRRKAIFPSVLLALHVAFMILHKRVVNDAPSRRVLEVGGLCLLFLCLGRSGYLLVVEWLLRYRLKRPLPRIFSDIIQVAIYFSVGFLTFHEMGAELGSLLTTSALLTAIVGLSLQETLGNLFAGLAIQAQKPFQMGDWIQVEGTPDSAFGRVVDINWRATKIQTFDQVEIVFPNAFLAKSPIRNFTQPTSLSRRTVRLRVPHEVLPDRMEAALLEAVRGCPGVLAIPAPRVWITQYADYAIEYMLLFYIDDFDFSPAIEPAVRKRIWFALQRAGIPLAYPVQDIRVRSVAEDSGERAELEQAKHRDRILRSVDFLNALPDEALEHLAQSSRTCMFAAGEDIIRQGEPGNELFVIRTGEAAVFVKQDERGFVQVAQLGPGGVFGEMSLVTGELRSATVRALSSCELIVLGHTAFREVLAQNPELANRISDVLANRQAQIREAQAIHDPHDHAHHSGVLLDKILNFFSLRPPSNQE